MKKIIAILLFMFILIGCQSNLEPSFENDYPSMKGTEHVYEKVTYTTALNFILDGTGVIVLGYNEVNEKQDTSTSQIIPILNEASIASDYDKILYLDIYSIQDTNNSEYRLLLGYLESATNDLLSRNGKKTILAPDVYFINKGKIVGHHIGTIENDNGVFIKQLNSDQKEELKNIYIQLFDKLKYS